MPYVAKQLQKLPNQINDPLTARRFQLELKIKKRNPVTNSTSS